MAISPHTRTRLIWREGKKVRAHRWIMEQHLGRKLALSEHVHHINGDPLDNRLENLVVLHQSAHIRLHNQKYPDVKKCVVCGKEYTAPNRKRQRSKCCSLECASEARAAGRKRQAASRSGSDTGLYGGLRGMMKGKSMSETPRTEKHCICGDNKAHCVDCLFELSCKLETELAEARADADHWKSECNALQRMVHEARAEIERKDKLIEQMRGALTKLIGTLEVMSVMPETLGKCPVLAIDAPELEQARAALAAERSE